jgi:hypothetical protein
MPGAGGGAPWRARPRHLRAHRRKAGSANPKLELEDQLRGRYPHRYCAERALKRARGNQKQFLTKIADTMRGRTASRT